MGLTTATTSHQAYPMYFKSLEALQTYASFFTLAYMLEYLMLETPCLLVLF